MKRVYIASPYYNGDQEKNVFRQITMFHALAIEGFLPYAPLLGHYVDVHYRFSYDWWLEFDMEWLKVCDCVLRLEGKSNGADKEVALAKKLGIPVYYLSLIHI